MAENWYIAEARNVDTLSDILESMGRRKGYEFFKPFDGHYLYVYLDRDDARLIEMIKSASGFKQFISYDSRPIVIDRLEAEKLRDSSQKQKPIKPIEEGSKVRIVSGPLTGAEGTLDEYLDSSYDRVKIYVDLMQKSIRVNIGIDDITRSEYFAIKK